MSKPDYARAITDALNDGRLEDAQRIIDAETRMMFGDDTYHYYCKECQENHAEKAECSKCCACLYRNATQIPDDMFPLFRCQKCGQVNFWD